MSVLMEKSLLLRAGRMRGAPSHNKWTAAALVSAGIFIAPLDAIIVEIILPKMMVSKTRSAEKSDQGVLMKNAGTFQILN
ncbi:MAG: hypothetical protein ABFD62_09950 [Syntrophaceae bacterium]